MQVGKDLKYPTYLYHKDFNEPKYVDNKIDEEALLNKGWRRQYIKKEYPKWVDGVIVQSKEEESERRAFLDTRDKMKVGKSTTVKTVHTEAK